jgi:hypothetical protein
VFPIPGWAGSESLYMGVVRVPEMVWCACREARGSTLTGGSLLAGLVAVVSAPVRGR